MGFIGAIITVHMQGRSVRIQEEEHQEKRQQKREQDLADDNAKSQLEIDEREKWARAVDFRAVAKHKPKLPGQFNPQEDGKLDVMCRAAFRGGIYEDVRLINLPLVDDDFRVLADRTEAPKLGPGLASTLEWKVSGRGWFDGDNHRALQWLNSHQVAVEFTDPNGARWRKDWKGKLLNLTGETSLATNDEKK